MKFYFFLLAVLPLAVAAAVGNIERTLSGIDVVYEQSADRRSSPVRFIQDVDREITRLFKAPKSAGNCRIVISPVRNPGDVTLRFSDGGRVDILMGDTFRDKIDDPAFQRDFSGALLLARFGVRDAAQKLPDWIAAGIFDALTVRLENIDRVVRTTRNYPLLRALLPDYPPDFRATMRVNGVILDGAGREAYSEICRFLLEMYASVSDAKDNALADYAVEMMRGKRREDEIFTATLDRRLRALQPNVAASPETLILQTAIRSVFHASRPRPGAALLVELSGALKTPVELPDREGNPSGTVRDFDCFQLAALYREPLNRKSADAARRQIVRQLRDFAAGLPPDIRTSVTDLADRVAELSEQTRESGLADLAASYRRVEEKLKWRAGMEAFMYRTELEKISGFLLFRLELNELFRPDDFLTRRGVVFLDEVEKRYMD
jgi:hypothetical protein